MQIRNWKMPPGPNPGGSVSKKSPTGYGSWEAQRDSWGDSRLEEEEAEERWKSALFRYPRRWKP